MNPEFTFADSLFRNTLSLFVPWQGEGEALKY